MQGFLSDEPDPSKGEARIESCLKRVVETTEQSRTTIAFEPVNHLQVGFHNSLDAVMALARRIDSPRFKPMLDSFHMNIEEANPAAAIRLAGDKIGYFHIGESNRGYLGDGVINFDLIFDALLDIDYQRDVVFESFSTAVVDEGLSLACAIWRDTWTDNVPLARHAKAFIELKLDEAARRRATNARP
jgi:D-psicose/D-tagatose/L-ribulose 3-epimerase